MPRKRVITVWTRAEMLGWMINYNECAKYERAEQAVIALIPIRHDNGSLQWTVYEVETLWEVSRATTVTRALLMARKALTK